MKNQTILYRNMQIDKSVFISSWDNLRWQSCTYKKLDKENVELPDN